MRCIFRLTFCTAVAALCAAVLLATDSFFSFAILNVIIEGMCDWRDSLVCNTARGLMDAQRGYVFFASSVSFDEAHHRCPETSSTIPRVDLESVSLAQWQACYLGIRPVIVQTTGMDVGFWKSLLQSQARRRASLLTTNSWNGERMKIVGESSFQGYFAALARAARSAHVTGNQCSRDGFTDTDVPLNALLPDSESTYVFDSLFFDDIFNAAIPVEFNMPHHLKTVVGRYPRSFLAIGGSGSGLGFHSHADAINIVLFGEKSWLLAPPGTSARGGNDQFIGDFIRRFPHVESPWLAFEQRAGEILYIPEGWIHATNNTSPCTVAASFQAAHLHTLGVRLRSTETEMTTDIKSLGAEGGNIDTLLAERVIVTRKLVETEPGAADNLLLHSRALLASAKRGNAQYTDTVAEALRFVERAVDLDPDHVPARVHLSQLRDLATR
eukprot:g3320.t1